MKLWNKIISLLVPLLLTTSFVFSMYEKLVTVNPLFQKPEWNDLKDMKFGFSVVEGDATPSTNDEINQINDALKGYNKEFFRECTRGTYQVRIVTIGSAEKSQHVPFDESKQNNSTTISNVPISEPQTTALSTLKDEVIALDPQFNDVKFNDMWNYGVDSDKAQLPFNKKDIFVKEEDGKKINAIFEKYNYKKRLIQIWGPGVMYYLLDDPNNKSMPDNQDDKKQAALTDTNPDTHATQNGMSYGKISLLAFGGATVITLTALAAFAGKKIYMAMNTKRLDAQCGLISALYKLADKKDAGVVIAYEAARDTLSSVSKKTHQEIKNLIDAQDYDALSKHLKSEYNRLSVLRKSNWIKRLFASFKQSNVEVI